MSHRLLNTFPNESPDFTLSHVSNSIWPRIISTYNEPEKHKTKYQNFCNCSLAAQIKNIKKSWFIYWSQKSPLRLCSHFRLRSSCWYFFFLFLRNFLTCSSISLDIRYVTGWVRWYYWNTSIL